MTTDDRILIERLNERVLNNLHAQEEKQHEWDEFIKEVKSFMTETLTCNADLRSCLKGYGNGEDGLIKKVKDNEEKLNQVDKRTWGIIIFLSASGIGAGTALIKILGG